MSLLDNLEGEVTKDVGEEDICPRFVFFGGGEGMV